MPSALFNLINLTALNLTGNRIDSMVGIGSLVSLVNLILDNNRISEIPDEVSELIKLRQISLKNNAIQKKSKINPDRQSFPSDFFKLTSIDTIQLDGNHEIRKSDILDFNGIEFFIERRKKSKEKSLQGGAMTDFDIFGLE
jgi:Leucine-rich repeat (LRR) protein